MPRQQSSTWPSRPGARNVISYGLFQGSNGILTNQSGWCRIGVTPFALHAT